MRNFLNLAGLKLLPLVLDLYLKTLRIKIYNAPGKNLNSIFIFWHSQMLVGWWLFKDRTSAALVSQSKDGEILTNVLSRWNYRIVRGSSSKGGKDALNELTGIVKDGYSAVITPDGPRGPANVIKNGALIISKETSVPVIPVKIIYHKKKLLKKSWDAFEIPFPFTQCEVYFGDKYYYENYLEGDDLEKFKQVLSNEM